MRFSTLVRWMMLIPACIIVWYGVFFAGLLTHGYIESNLCPPEQFISGFCDNTNIRELLDITIHVFVALSAMAVVTTAAVMAAAYKQHVIVASYLAGGLIATLFGYTADSWSLTVAALTGGLMTVAPLLIFLRLREKPGNIE